MERQISKRAMFVILVSVLSLLNSLAEARVTRIEITTREIVADGMAFGDTGPYEKLRGTVYFGVDPDDSRNAVVFDLDRAPRNARGLVEFSADFFILKPVDLKKGNGGLFFEVNGRGNKNSWRLMNDTCRYQKLGRRLWFFVLRLARVTPLVALRFSRCHGLTSGTAHGV